MELSPSNASFIQATGRPSSALAARTNADRAHTDPGQRGPTPLRRHACQVGINRPQPAQRPRAGQGSSGDCSRAATRRPEPRRRGAGAKARVTACVKLLQLPEAAQLPVSERRARWPRSTICSHPDGSARRCWTR
jgi:hypothetical protein